MYLIKAAGNITESSADNLGQAVKEAADIVRLSPGSEAIVFQAMRRVEAVVEVKASDYVPPPINASDFKPA